MRFANTRLSSVGKKAWLVLLSGVMAFSLAACGQSADTTDKTETTSSGTSDNVAKEDGKLQVVGSFYPVCDFTEKIGGEHVEVTQLVPPATEPHDWEPSATDMLALEKADVFVYNGAGMEPWLDSVLAANSNDAMIKVEASQGITLLNGHSHEQEEVGHEEADEDITTADPHVWLNPMNAKKEMENIAAALIEADPENEADYQAQLELWSARCDELDALYQEKIDSYSKKDIVVQHEAFAYLCDRYGLTQVGIQGLSPDVEPDAASMMAVVDFVKANDVKVIFFEELVSPRLAEKIASETGATTAVLSPIEGLTKEEIDAGADYFSIMERNLEALQSALS